MNDDILERFAVFVGGKAALEVERALEDDRFVHRRFAERAGRDELVLLLNRGDDVGGVQVASAHLRRVEPNAEAVRLFAPDRDVADAVNAGNRVANAERNVVAEVNLVVFVPGRNEVDHHQ